MNPSIHVDAVDRDSALFTAWKSNDLPIFEPGLKDLIFMEYEGPNVEQSGPHDSNGHVSPNQTSVGSRHSRLPELSFSTQIHDAVASAQIIFLCIDTPLKVSNVSRYIFTGRAAHWSIIRPTTAWQTNVSIWET